MKNLAPELTTEIRTATQNAALFNGGPGVDYRTLRDAYAVNATLMYGIEYGNSSEIATPTRDTEILIVRRGSGDGVHGSWSGVSGFIDRPDVDDPLEHAILAELQEEIGIQDSDLDNLKIGVGQRFTELRKTGGILHVVPVSITADHRPNTRPDGREVLECRWVKLGHIATLGTEITFSPGYLDTTLPNALTALDLTPAEARKLVRVA